MVNNSILLLLESATFDVSVLESICEDNEYASINDSHDIVNWHISILWPEEHVAMGGKGEKLADRS